MYNLFKMEIYRALKSKTVIVTLLIMGVLNFITVFTGTLGVSSNTGINICNEFTTILSNQMLLIIWAIMVSVYIAAEYKSGFVKSIAGQISNRSYLAISKFLLAVVYTIAMFVISFIFVSLAALLFGRGNVIFGFTPQMILLWSIQLILHIGFSCIFILVTTLTRSSSFGIALGIFTGCGLTNLIYTGIDWIVNKIGIVEGFSLGSYMIETNVQYMLPGIPMDYIYKAAIVGIAFILIMMFVSMKTLNERDI